MKRINFDGMPVSELWGLHEKIGSLLTEKITAEKRALQERLDALAGNAQARKARRPYPKVSAKFRNPDQPSQTWSGRGLQPRWISEMLSAGKCMDDLRIPERA